MNTFNTYTSKYRQKSVYAYKKYFKQIQIKMDKG